MSLHTLVLLAGDEHQMADIEPLIDAQQAARILRLHPVTIREMAARRELPGLKIGKVWRFRVSSLDAWVQSQLQWERHPHSEEKP
jgi:excisionase family DNA binding protein